jgi:septum formation protein
LNRTFILASKSPRRSELLKRCLADFSVITADTEELSHADDLEKLPEYNALQKARAVAYTHPSAWVLGADTMIIFDGRAIGKPRDLIRAAEFLREFSSKTHKVITGMALVCREENISEVWSEVSEVKFKNLSGAVIDDYLQKVQVLDKAGAYAIQEHGDMIVESFTGELENIIGMPLAKLKKFLAVPCGLPV